MNRLEKLAKKYDLKLNRNGNEIKIKPRFNILKKDNIGLMLISILTFLLALFIITKTKANDILMLTFSIVLMVVSIFSLIVIFKTFNDILLINNNNIKFTNSLIKKSFKTTDSLKFRLKKEDIEFNLKRSKGYYTIVDLYIIHNKSEYRFLDITSDMKNSLEIMELGYLIIDELEKTCNIN